MANTKFRIAPLPGTVMLTGMLGFIIVTVYAASGRISPTWAVAFDAVFICMFIASLISITPWFPAWKR